MILARPTPASRAQAERAIELAVAAPLRARALAETALAGARAAQGRRGEITGRAGARSLSARAEGRGDGRSSASARGADRREGAARRPRGRGAHEPRPRPPVHGKLDGRVPRDRPRRLGALHGLPAARLQLQRAILLHHHYRLDEALAGYRASLVGLPPCRRSALGGSGAQQPRTGVRVSRLAGRCGARSARGRSPLFRARASISHWPKSSTTSAGSPAGAATFRLRSTTSTAPTSGETPEASRSRSDRTS